MANQQGIAIVIKAFMATGKTLNEQFEALSKVKTAHETGDYSEVLKASTIDEVKAEQKTRRIEDAPPTPPAPPASGEETQADIEDAINAARRPEDGDEPSAPNDPAGDPAEVPAFLKKGKTSKAA